MLSFTCAARTAAGKPCRLPAGWFGYCHQHDPGDQEGAIIVGELATEKRDPCPRCGTTNNQPQAGLAGFLWHHPDCDSAPLCGGCLHALDPVKATLLDIWASATAHLGPDWRRYLHLALVNDLATRQVGADLDSGNLQPPEKPQP